MGGGGYMYISGGLRVPCPWVVANQRGGGDSWIDIHGEGVDTSMDVKSQEG